MKCPNCGSNASDTDNFCMRCGAKLKKTCNCWVKKKDNYDCGESSCPGLKLFSEELKKTKERTSCNEKSAKRLNRASAIIAGLAVFLTIIACLDKIVLLVGYVLSYPH